MAWCVFLVCGNTLLSALLVLQLVDSYHVDHSAIQPPAQNDDFAEQRPATISHAIVKTAQRACVMVTPETVGERRKERREICFQSCNTECAAEVERGSFFLSCFIAWCSPTVVTRRRSKGRKTAIAVDRHPVGIDRFPNSQSRLLALPDSRAIKRAVVLQLDSLRKRRVLKVDVESLRRQVGGLGLAYFSARVGVLSGDSTCLPAVRFVVNAEREGSTQKLIPTTTVATNGSSRDILANLNGARMIRLVAFIRQSLPANCSVYAVWAAAQLTIHRPRFPACNWKCDVEAHLGRLYLPCLLGTCPGAALDTLQTPFANIGLVHRRARLCVDCSSNKRRYSPARLLKAQPLRRAIGAQADSKISFNLTAVRRAGLGRFSIFKTVVGVDARTLRKCRPLRHDRGASLEFRLYLDGELNRAVRYSDIYPSGKIALHIGAAQLLTLATANIKKGSLCNQAIWGNPRLERGSLPPFPPCLAECERAFRRNRIFLSCFLAQNTCSGKSVRISNFPFAIVRKTRWGAGVNTAGDWLANKAGARASWKRIRFAGRSSRPFRHGIGLRAPGHVQFNLTAIREEGLVFNHFHAVVGIDIASQDDDCDGSLGGEARLYADDHLLMNWRFAHPWPDIRSRPGSSAGKLIFVNVEKYKMLRLVSRNPFGHQCPHVAFGDASLRLLRTRALNRLG